MDSCVRKVLAGVALACVISPFATGVLSAEPPLDPIFIRKVAYRAMATDQPEVVAAVRTMMAKGFFGQVLASARETFEEGPSDYLDAGGLAESVRSHVDGWTMTEYGLTDRWEIVKLEPTQGCPDVWVCVIRVLRADGTGPVAVSYDVVHHDTRTDATWKR